jgi:hypothetical protein
MLSIVLFNRLSNLLGRENEEQPTGYNDTYGGWGFLYDFAFASPNFSAVLIRRWPGAAGRKNPMLYVQELPSDS